MCGTDLICPDDQVCIHLSDPAQDLCADPKQIDDCNSLDDHQHCGPTGRCYPLVGESRRVCLAIACGNGRVDVADPSDPSDVGEVCDDGNVVSGDHCSADCRSLESCGNGIADFAASEQCDDGDYLSNDGCDSVCRQEASRWTELALTPGDYVVGSIAYDIARDRIVLFGDDAFNESNVTWEGTPTGWLLAQPTSALPLARLGAAVSYDSKHHRTVLFGGSDFADTWTWDGTRWENRSPAAGNPLARSGHALVYDAKNDRTVMFGGVALGTQRSDETWFWDGAMWTELDVEVKPPGRSGHAMAYDPERGVIVMWGGSTDDTNVWELHDQAWTSIAPVGRVPPLRNNASMAYDPSGHRMILVGGDTFGIETVDAWSWKDGAWTQLTAPPKFMPGHRMTTDFRRGEIVLLATTPTVLGHPIRYTGRWTYVDDGWVVAEDPPTLTSSQTQMVLDPLRGTEVSFGGAGIAELDGGTWRVVDPGPDRLLDTSLAYDPVSKQEIMFGGAVDGELVADTWSWKDSRLELLQVASERPSPRSQAALCASDDRIVMFGGSGSDGELSDTWEWNGTTWLQRTTLAAPPARARAAIAYDPIRRVVVLFGGWGMVNGMRGELSDTWTWDGTSWTHHDALGPTPRAGARMAWDASRRRLVLFGGSAGQHVFVDAWEWDGSTWLSTQASDGARAATNFGFASAQGAGVMLVGGTNAGHDDRWRTTLLRWDSTSASEGCRAKIDLDHDGLKGCEDPDCWWACTPLCPPGTSCDPSLPHCGDGVCNRPLEDGWICDDDCTRPVICGDSMCDQGETAASCPGDCP